MAHLYHEALRSDIDMRLHLSLSHSLSLSLSLSRSREREREREIERRGKSVMTTLCLQHLNLTYKLNIIFIILNRWDVSLMNTLCQRCLNASNMACRLRVDGLIIHFSERETERDRDRQTDKRTDSESF